jgi:hypothetical protein
MPAICRNALSGRTISGSPPVSLSTSAGTAAKIAGVSPRAFFNWLRLGREGASPAYVQFVQRIAVAEAKGEEELMGYSLRKVVAEEQPLTPEQAHKLVAEAAALLSTSRQEPPR